MGMVEGGAVVTRLGEEEEDEEEEGEEDGKAATPWLGREGEEFELARGKGGWGGGAAGVKADEAEGIDATLGAVVGAETAPKGRAVLL